jgi:hypothetical protein
MAVLKINLLSKGSKSIIPNANPNAIDTQVLLKIKLELLSAHCLFKSHK